MKKKLIIVSNRLPITITKNPHSNRFQYNRSQGGLVRGVNDFFKHSKKDAIWIGWCGLSTEHTSPKERKSITQYLIKKYRYYPIFLSNDLIRKYYHEFCNESLWSSFHNLTNNVCKMCTSKNIQGYLEANKIFADVVMTYIRSDSIVWIHDYHCMMVPQYLRNEGILCKICFFLHIPFPQLSEYAAKNNFKDIIKSLNMTDLIGFQTQKDQDYFIQSIMFFDKLKTKPIVHPIPVDFNYFHKLSIRHQKIKPNSSTQMILSVDRIDPIKNIPNKIKAFRLLLKNNPCLVNKIILTIVCIDSRLDGNMYYREKQKIETEINKTRRLFPQQTTINYINQSISDDQLVQLFRMADIALITSKADGMNLVCKEFVASNMDLMKSVLITKDMGVSHGLSCLKPIDCWDATTIYHRLESVLMYTKKYHDDFQQAKQLISKDCPIDWANDFIKQSRDLI